MSFDHILAISIIIYSTNGIERMTDVYSFLSLYMSLVQPVHLICCSNHVPALSTLGSLHDNHILYPIIKVLYALHTLLERIAASKTLESPRGEGRVMNNETGKGRQEGGGREGKE